MQPAFAGQPFINLLRFRLVLKVGYRVHSSPKKLEIFVVQFVKLLLHEIQRLFVKFGAVGLGLGLFC